MRESEIALIVSTYLEKQRGEWDYYSFDDKVLAIIDTYKEVKKYGVTPLINSLREELSEYADDLDDEEKEDYQILIDWLETYLD